MLVHASSNHRLKHHHVAVVSSAHHAIPAEGLELFLSRWRRVARPWLLLTQNQQDTPESLVDARDARQLDAGERAEHDDEQRRQLNQPLKQLHQLLAGFAVASHLRRGARGGRYGCREPSAGA